MLTEDETPVVCRVTPDGQVICDPVSPEHMEMDSGTPSELEAALKKAYPDGNWGPNKVALALRVLETLGKSTLADERVPRRAGEVVDSTRLLMDKQPPSILLYNYSTQPANILGAYFLNTGNLVEMQRLYDQFKNPVPY